jgi:hypothetical protein
MATLYKIIVLGVQGINNKVFGPDVDLGLGAGVVSDEHFPEGNAELLCKAGKLKLLSKDENVKTSKADTKAAKAAKLKELQDIIDNCQETFDKAKLALEGAAGDNLLELQKVSDDAELALNIANDNFDNA